MNKQFIISIIAILLLNSAMYAAGNAAFSNRDTLPADRDIMVFREMPTFFPWLRFDIDISSRINSPSFQTETRHYQIHNGQYSIRSLLEKQFRIIRTDSPLILLQK